jgi:hypothetical protein
LAPLQERFYLAWLYTGLNDKKRLWFGQEATLVSFLCRGGAAKPLSDEVIPL